jgi:4-carboxymuconolactone decarboxylase
MTKSIRRLSFVLIATLGATAAIAQQRLGPVPPDKMNDEQKKVVEDIKTGPRKEIFGPLAPIMRSPTLAYTMERFGETVYYTSSLDKKIYELAVVLLARATDQQFEWRVHYPAAIKAGIKKEDVDAIAAGRKPRTLADDEQRAYDFFTDILVRNEVSDKNYTRFLEKFGERAVVDGVGLLGYYYSIAVMLNVDRTPLNPGDAPMLPKVRKRFP